MPFQQVDDEHKDSGDDSKDDGNSKFVLDDVLRSLKALQKGPYSSPFGT